MSLPDFSCIAPGFDVRRSRRESIRVVHVTGEVDMITMDEFAEPVFEELAARPHGVVVDLRDVRFIGSSGLRVLVQAKARAEELDIGFRLVADHPAVLRTLEISGLTGYFPLHSALDEAVTSLTAA